MGTILFTTPWNIMPSNLFGNSKEIVMYHGFQNHGLCHIQWNLSKWIKRNICIRFSSNSMVCLRSNLIYNCFEISLCWLTEKRVLYYFMSTFIHGLARGWSYMIHDQTYHQIDIQYQISHFIFTIPDFVSLYLK